MKKLLTLALMAVVSSSALAGEKCGTVRRSNGVAMKSQCNGTVVASRVILTSLPVHAAAESDIVDTAVKAGSFKTLVAAVKAAA